MLRNPGTRGLAALAVAVLLAGPPSAGAAGRGVPAEGALETLWSWVQAVLCMNADKGICIDPDGAASESEAGHLIDPDGAAAESDKGSFVDPNG